MIIETTESQTREALFIKLYETAFPKVAAFIRKMGGSFDEAKDVFQDALVIYYEKTSEPGFEVQSDEKTYITGICKHLWYKQYRDNILKQALDITPELKVQENSEPIVSEHILSFIEVSGKKCLELLKAFYYDKLNMKDVADKFNFSGERSATAQKYKCLEKVRMAIRTGSLTKEDFYE